MFYPLKFSGPVSSSRPRKDGTFNEYDASLVKKILVYHFQMKPSDYWSTRVISAIALSSSIDTMYDQMMQDVGEDWNPDEIRTYSKKAVVAASKPLPLNIAEWMMLGPGVNTPLEGWKTAREKMDKIKIAWYGKGGETQPDPMEDEHLEQLFTRYQAGLGINLVGTNG